MMPILDAKDENRLADPLKTLRETMERSSALMRRAAFEQVPIGKILQTSDGTLRAINHTLCLMLGYTEVEMLTLTVPELKHPEDVTRDWEQYQALLAGRIEAFSLEKRTFWRCGRALWGPLTLSVIRDSGGKIEWIVSQIQELVPGSALSPVPAPMPQRPPLLEDMAQVGTWEWEPATGACRWSDEFYRIYGLVPGAVEPSFELSLQYIHSEDRELLREALRQAIALLGEGQMHCRVLRPDGCERQVLIQIRVLPHPVRVSCLLLDVTEQWQKARLLEQTNFLLSEQNRQLEHFARMATHNLRSPLANAITMLQMLEEDCSESERLEYQALLASSLAQTLDNLDEMVVQIYHQVPDGLERQRVRFQDALDRTLLILAPEHKSSQARIKTDFACEELDYVSVYLHSIVYNLVSNAFKYRSPERQLELSLRSWGKEGQIFLEVTDNGIGIDLKLNGHRIFKPGEVFTAHADAHGIGLYLTRQQIESLGGEMSVTSKPGIGTCFRIRF